MKCLREKANDDPVFCDSLCEGECSDWCVKKLEEALDKINTKANAQTAQVNFDNIDKGVALQHYAVIVEFVDIISKLSERGK